MIERTMKAKLQKCMDTCFKLITYLPPTPLNYKKEKMFRLDDLMVLENAKLSYKLEHNLLPQTLHDMLVSDSKNQSLEKKHKYSTRSKGIPKRPTALTRHYHSSYLFQSLKDYENICPKIINSNTLGTFTLRLKKKIIKRMTGLSPDL